MDQTDLSVQQTIQAICTVLSPTSTQDQRSRANSFIEEVKNCDNAQLSLSLGYKLITSNINDNAMTADAITAFGFQIIELVIRSKWNSMNVVAKGEIKTCLEEMVKSTYSLNHRSKNVIHSLSKCMVECMKREWPQNWENLLNLLLSTTKSECTLYVLWRLAEDVGVFYLPQNHQRRRELLSELIANLNPIMNYISDCLTAEDIDVCLTALQTLTGFLEWCQLSENLFSFLCGLLSPQTDQLSVAAKVKQLVCNCLIVCLSRKGLKLEERKTFLSLFSEANINNILLALKTSIENLGNDTSDDSWNVTKRLSYVLSLMGQVVVTLNSEEAFEITTWPLYLEAQIHLFSCKNQVLNSISLQFWRDVVRFTEFRQKLLTSQILSRIVQTIPLKLLKSSELESDLGFEFDSQEDYEAFFYKFRAELLDYLRSLTSLDEKFCFEYLTQLLQSITAKREKTKQSDWEIFALLSDAICNRIRQIDSFASYGSEAIRNILDVMSCENDADCMSSQLSCLSAFFVFFPQSNDTEVLKAILEKVFFLAVFNPVGQTKQTRTKEVKNLRRHACSAFVKLCRAYPVALMPFFTDVKSYVDKIAVDEMSQMEKCALNEGLLLVSNEFSSVDSQKLLIHEILSSFTWFREFNLSTEQFVSYVGLNLKPEEIDLCGQKRATLMYSVNSILGILKRVTRKAALIPEVFAFIKPLSPLVACLNSIWKHENQLLVHENYRDLVFSPFTDAIRLQILEMPISNSSSENTSDKSTAHRLQMFLWALHENSFSVLTSALTLLSPEMYSEFPDFTNFLTEIEYLPDSKLRMVLKLLVRPLVCSGPQDYSFYKSTVIPIVQTFLSFLFRRINTQWESLRAKTNNASTDEANEIMETEVIKEQLCRLLSRDFVDFMTNMLIEQAKPKHEANDDIETQDMEMAENFDKSGNDGTLSELGCFLINQIPDVIIMNSVSLTWMDTNASLKAAAINALIFKKLISENVIQNADEAMFLFQQVLTSLNYFGEHEQNQASLLHLMLVLYEGLVVKQGVIDVKERLAGITNRSVADWDNFQEKWMKPVVPGKPAVSEKRKKDAMKNLLGSIVGKNVGQLYKRNQEDIRSLRPKIFGLIHRKAGILDQDLKLCNLFDS